MITFNFTDDSNPLQAPMRQFRRLLDQELPPHLRDGADVTAYRAIVGRHEALLCTGTPEIAKDNAAAARFRQIGNRALVEEKNLTRALRYYNRAICYAVPGSEDLGIAYANRSAVFCKTNEFEFALYNIDLARAHNYPERLQHKLVAREAECKRMISIGNSKGVIPHPMADINVAVNPKIPFLAKGIVSAQSGDKGMVSERDFNVGDVILDEKIELCNVAFEERQSYCVHCGSAFEMSLIPCPGCVTVMYCGEKCREQDFQIFHRFECGVATKHWAVAYTNFLISAKFFFYGLTAFKDNVDAMMEYCLPNAAVGSDTHDLDLTNPNPLGVFKILHQTKPTLVTSEHHNKLNAALYHLIFLKNPLVQSIFRTDAQRDFLLQCLLIHVRLSTIIFSNQRMEVNYLPLVTTFINRSCDPNVVHVTESGRDKLIVIRPIKPGDQILNSTTTEWWKKSAGDLKTAGCRCAHCHPGLQEGAAWRAAYSQVRPISSELGRDLLALEHSVMIPSYELVKWQRIVQRLAREGHYPSELFGSKLASYFDLLIYFVVRENFKRDRARLLELRGDEVIPSFVWDV